MKRTLLALALVGAAALPIGLMSLSPRLAFKSNPPCRLSGTVTTNQGRLVTGIVHFSCVALSADELDSRRGFVAFPTFTVPVVKGEYLVTERDGLAPGSYQVTVVSEKLEGAVAIASGPTPTPPTYQSDDGSGVVVWLIQVSNRPRQSLNFEVEA
jgi:hypothetical protein